ncbi:MAG: sulfurtransferase, partial [Deinococcus sp.]
MPPPLIPAQELRTALATSPQGLRLLDCRFVLSEPGVGEAAYREGHLPGAAYAHLERDLSGPRQPDGVGGRHPLPDPEVLASWLGEQGIGDGDTVVAYD